MQETSLYCLVLCILIIIPCVFIGFLGRTIITQIGLYPTRAPQILTSVKFSFLVVIEAAFMAMLVVFYRSIAA